MYEVADELPHQSMLIIESFFFRNNIIISRFLVTTRCHDKPDGGTRVSAEDIITVIGHSG